MRRHPRPPVSVFFPGPFPARVFAGPAGLVTAVLAFALLGLAGCERDPDLALPEEYRSLEVPAERLDSADARVRGRELYVSLCALCHGWQGDGKGTQTTLSTNPRDFTNPRWQKGMTPKRTYWVIQEGRKGTAMASFSFLSPDQTWDLVAYVLSIAEKGALVEGVDAEASSTEAGD